MARRIVILAAASVLLSASAASGSGAGSSAAPGKAQVWFAPLPPMPMYEGRRYIGAPDFMKLFSRKASWTRAARRVTVFKLYGEWVHHVASDRQLRRVVADLRRREIALALETGPLDPTSECGEGIEGFATRAAGTRMARRIKAAGGDLRQIALDEPLFYAARYQGLRACRWDGDRVARRVADFVEAVREVFPRVAVGDTEPLTSPGDVAAYVQWLDTYRAVSGQRFAFVHLDVSYSLPGWETMARTIEAAARDRGVPFGIIVFGEPIDATDRAWIARARERIERYEVDAGGLPDHVLFQSWQDRPDRTLPDRSASTFAGLVRTYARPRTRLTLRADPTAPGTYEVSGGLASGSRPLARARVDVSAGLSVAGAEPIPLASTTSTTDSQGRFRASLPGLPGSGLALRARYAGSSKLWPAVARLNLGASLSNLARARPATASAALSTNPPALAVDGDPESAWISGTGPPAWIELDLGPPATVFEVRLRVAQTPAGATAHRISAFVEGLGWVTLADLSGQTAENQVLTARPTAAIANVRLVRVETTQSPSWIAWREIEVLGSR
jgi:hypothetical protein